MKKLKIFLMFFAVAIFASDSFAQNWRHTVPTEMEAYSGVIFWCAFARDSRAAEIAGHDRIILSHFPYARKCYAHNHRFGWAHQRLANGFGDTSQFDATIMQHVAMGDRWGWRCRDNNMAFPTSGTAGNTVIHRNRCEPCDLRTHTVSNGVCYNLRCDDGHVIFNGMCMPMCSQAFSVNQTDSTVLVMNPPPDVTINQDAVRRVLGRVNAALQ